ncbi:hypothetical protein DPMN_088802 [Dreissena polymorpha]|uniref:Uncharacterized protein n=1 Tax=Dreissena polymorpha TaxID=45954 RepID=A0A9D4KV77_DREPO|nr:hypothetical protein DPMN_088802 [Dreissena polymorpha]
MANAQRSIDIAKERGMSLKQILSHDLISSPQLFDADLTAAHVYTSNFIGEIEDCTSINGVWNLFFPLMSSWTSCLRCDGCHLYNFPIWVVQSMLSSTQRQT